MDGLPNLHPGLVGHHSFRPNIHHTGSSSHVNAEQVPDEDKPSDRRKHKSSHRHHHHHSSRRDKEHRHSSSRRHARDVVQSAIQLPPTSFGDLLKQARGSKDTTPSHSRKGSVAHGVDGNSESRQGGDVGITIPPRRPLRPEDVELERRRVEARERDLHVALKSLSDQSFKTSRRLDDTYYSILEKVSVLRQTIGTLQELSGLTNELHENFESDTKELVEDVQGQIGGFGSFDTQQKLIVDLEERVAVGKTKAESLTKRLATAKERVDARARSEVEWAAKNTRRVRMFWGILGSLATLVLAFVVFHHFKPLDVAHDPRPTLGFASRAHILEAHIPDIAKEAIIGLSLSTSPPDSTSSSVTKVPDDDERLRMFDEL